MKKEKNLIIHSYNNNKYIYDCNTNIILSVEEYQTQSLKKHVKPIGEKVMSIDDMFAKPRALCLVLTDMCNFRCRYCANSAAYDYSKGYRNQTMSLETIDKALDLYVSLYRNSIRNDPNVRFGVSFYGGEPLLEIEKIKYVVQRIEKDYRIENPLYSITTNGFILSNEMIELFYNYSFEVAVSIDGYPEIHDLNRRTISGKETYKKVVTNFRKLKDKIQQKAGIITTFDTQVSPQKLYKYYRDNPDIDERLWRVASVTPVNTTYYDIVTKYEKYEEELNDLYRRFYNGDHTMFLKKMFEDKFGIIVEKDTDRDYLYGICNPLNAKLTVSTDGVLHICEKINENYPIGTVDGIDKKTAFMYYKNLIELREAHCKECLIKNLCNPCYATLNGAGKRFEIDEDFCKKTKRSIIHTLALFCTFQDDAEWPTTHDRRVNDNALSLLGVKE